MKSFLSKNWKKILIFIAIVLIALNIINKCTAPHTIVSDYAKYGPDAEASSNIRINTDKIVNEMKEGAPKNIPSDVMRLGIILVVGIIGATIINDWANRKPAPKKK